GLHSQYIPNPTAEIGHCVHRIAMHPARPNTLYMQKHWDVMRTDDAGENWREVSGNLPTDFGFPIDVHAHEPETIYVVPIKSDSEHYPPEGKLRVYRSRTGGNEWEPLTKGLPQQDCYVNVLREAMDGRRRYNSHPGPSFGKRTTGVHHAKQAQSNSRWVSHHHGKSGYSRRGQSHGLLQEGLWRRRDHAHARSWRNDHARRDEGR